MCCASRFWTGGREVGSEGRGCLEEERLGVPGQVWEFRSCCLFLYFLGKIAVQEMSGRTPGSPRHPSSRHPWPSDWGRQIQEFARRAMKAKAGPWAHSEAPGWSSRGGGVASTQDRKTTTVSPWLINPGGLSRYLPTSGCWQNLRKIRAPIKIKSALPPPPPQKKTQKRGILRTWFFLQKERIFPGVHKIGAPISGARIADTNFTDTRIFLKIHAQYDTTTGCRTMEMNGGSSASYLARTPRVPLFRTLFSKGVDKSRRLTHFFRAARVQNEIAPEKFLNRYEKRFEKREKGSEKRSETRLKHF